MPEKKTAAVEAEANEAPVTFEHNGIEYTIPAPLDFPLEVIEAETEIDVIRAVLGDEQWTKYRATKPTIRDFQALTEKVNGASGN